MALRDVAGVLNGLRKVATALYTETTSELQNSLSGGRSVAASSLYKTAGQGWSEYGELKWASKWRSSGGFDGEFFPEWGDLENGNLFPTTENSFGPPQHKGEDAPKIPPPQQSTVDRVEPVDKTSILPPPPSPPTYGQHPVGRSREYHTLATRHTRLLAQRGGSSWQWFHSSTRYGDETVAGSGSRSEGPVDSTAKSKPPKPKQKVSLHLCCISMLTMHV